MLNICKKIFKIISIIDIQIHKVSTKNLTKIDLKIILQTYALKINYLT